MTGCRYIVWSCNWVALVGDRGGQSGSGAKVGGGGGAIQMLSFLASGTDTIRSPVSGIRSLIRS